MRPQTPKLRRQPAGAACEKRRKRDRDEVRRAPQRQLQTLLRAARPKARKLAAPNDSSLRESAASPKPRKLPAPKHGGAVRKAHRKRLGGPAAPNLGSWKPGRGSPRYTYVVWHGVEKGRNMKLEGKPPSSEVASSWQQPGNGQSDHGRGQSMAARLPLHQALS